MKGWRQSNPPIMNILLTEFWDQILRQIYLNQKLSETTYLSFLICKSSNTSQCSLAVTSSTSFSDNLSWQLLHPFPIMFKSLFFNKLPLVAPAKIWHDNKIDKIIVLELPCKSMLATKIANYHFSIISSLVLALSHLLPLSWFFPYSSYSCIWSPFSCLCPRAPAVIEYFVTCWKKKRKTLWKFTNVSAEAASNRDVFIPASGWAAGRKQMGSRLLQTLETRMARWQQWPISTVNRQGGWFVFNDGNCSFSKLWGHVYAEGNGLLQCCPWTEQDCLGTAGSGCSLSQEPCPRCSLGVGKWQRGLLKLPQGWRKLAWG